MLCDYIKSIIYKSLLRRRAESIYIFLQAGCSSGALCRILICSCPVDHSVTGENFHTPRGHFVGRTVLIASLLLLVLAGTAQVKISFYADTSNSLINKSIRVLKEQLGKSESIDVAIATQSLFKEKGILLSSQPEKWSVYAKALNGKGSEAVIVKSVGNGIVIIGNSELAVQHGVFIYLEAIGFRYYFPHPDWYIIPATLNLYPAINYLGRPSFDQRRIWYGYSSAGSKASNDNYAFWFMANKLGGAMNAVIGHAYDDIVARNMGVFKAHPEWFYPAPAKGTIPVNPKFDLANESLLQFVVADALKRLEKAKLNNTPISMITMSPSDGGGTCNSPRCQQLGTITDRVYSLINRVAKEVGQKYPGTWVSGMSYSEYAEPPTKKLEPNTFVSIATAFNYSKYSTDELIGAWSKKAGKVGIYNYLGLYAWDFDLPGKGYAAKPVDKITALINKYYRLGAKGYDAESTPGSINKGLGHYMVAHLLWNVNADTKAMEKEFFSGCFGKAAKIMSALWTEWENYSYTVVRATDLAAWIDMTDQAALIEQSAAIRKRLTHIKVYLHYLYLYNNFLNTSAEADRLSLLTYSYNTFDITAFSGYPVLWEIGQASGIPGLLINDPNAKYKQLNPLFSQAAYTDQLVAADRKTLQKKDKLKSFNLPARFQKVAEPPVFKEKNYNYYKGNNFFIGPHYFVFEIIKPGAQNYMDLAGGIVTGGGGDKSINVSVSAY
ncbi:MAG: beta-hexosaminidase precursor, partial [Chitinophagaceae bacterium]|nr:beta-hexosaminidase precursor [Chitinophagaceae bacterium]